MGKISRQFSAMRTTALAVDRQLAAIAKQLERIADARSPSTCRYARALADLNPWRIWTDRGGTEQRTCDVCDATHPQIVEFVHADTCVWVEARKIVEGAEQP